MTSAHSRMPEAAEFFYSLQERIVADLETIDGEKFQKEVWDRPAGGGGITQVLTEGGLFEKAGVNVSDVVGSLRSELALHLPGDGDTFRATGLSLVLHPRNPYVPTIHANVRYIQRGEVGWFGGGTDLTPYYVEPDDVRLFHQALKAIGDRHHPSLYPRFKSWCDRYFFLPHRNEPRGVGGLFFDYLGAGSELTAGVTGARATTDWEDDPERVFALVRDLGDHCLDAYHLLIQRRRHQVWGERERDWQLVRRGRYAEFNLVYDRGTLFGLHTDGRTESILMSLPPEVRWRYGAIPEAGSAEAQSLEHICAKRDWVSSA